VIDDLPARSNGLVVDLQTDDVDLRRMRIEAQAVGMEHVKPFTPPKIMAPSRVFR
jgi:hypothetical protein